MPRQMVVLVLISIALVGFACATAHPTSPSAAPKTAPGASPTKAPTAAPKSPKSAASPPWRHHGRSPPTPSSGSDSGSTASDAAPADAPASSGTVMKGSAGALVVAAYFLF
ncbi:hypothetical protein HanRHA438_Chr15g0697851 [Helianthus annuus]|uniref:classical arabinogalactan protein 11-like n=1 Tax=Helianthus annuus TaxID=4232 RepID=UPI000B8FA537|nr:classical arabinogalactan protein 11-like [Helianthus annuus]KAJ0454890.1 hypothetical protein HanIR_Chr15g0745081 [Helianthus annuus]KAJ0844029.1 hypothetical protein HanRHA438_Chr15g0697851 [Helianthus annuus]